MTISLNAVIRQQLVLIAVVAAMVGCQERADYETRKPVVDPTAEERAEEGAADNAAAQPATAPADTAPNDPAPDNTAPNNDDEAADAPNGAAAAEWSNRPIVNIDTPLGDVTVGEDPATGRTNVEVDTERADVDVDAP